MIDLHCHVLPGIDDGPRTLEGSLQLARAAAAAGIETLVATPHVNSRCRNDAATIARLTEDVNERLEREDVPVRVLPGAEVAITSVAEIEPRELARLGLGAGGWLLMEPPFSPVARGVENVLMELKASGHDVVIAHPERCPAFQRDPATVRALVDAGALVSITAGSLAGRFGSEPRRCALALARAGLVHNVTSDAHDVAERAPGLRAEIAHAGLGALNDWLTEEVPRAILTDTEIPPPPPVAVRLAEREAPRRRLWRARR